MNEKYELTRNMQCLCGSGKKFKSCCNEYMSLSSFDKISIEIENKNYQQALLFCRAEITRYMCYVKRHTEFLLVIDPLRGKIVLDIDIKALSELLNKLMYIISMGDTQVSFISNLDRLGELFYNQHWHNRLRYYKVAWEYIFNNNGDDAKKLLVNLSYEEIRDLDFLQMYLDLMSDELSFSTRLEIVDKLINMETKVAGKLQYYGAKAIQFLLINDLERAKELVSQAISIAEENFTDISEPYDYFQFGNIYHLGGKLLDNEGLHKKSILLFELMLETDELSLSGRAELYSHIGDVYLFLNEVDIALSYYNKSLEL
ncbi:SEC-C metal-binding domain-containing protein, partial [Paenibacillus sp. 7516]|uniref:tetratricopeptide repeat protein n=1 Tax=Paenibacillus sp. 7516 TaxID=2022549 RepID=UPI000BA778A0